MGTVEVATAVIGIVIFVVILTALGGTVVENTDTSAGTSLENASATGII